MDRQLMMWDILKTIIAAAPDQNGTLFIAFGNTIKSEELLQKAKVTAHAGGGSIKDNTIDFEGTRFIRCDKFFVDSGEVRGSMHTGDLTGMTAPFFTALLSETISLINNVSEKNVLYFLVLSLKKNLIDNKETYAAQQSWFMKCYSCRVMSIYSSNMLKYGVIGECLTIEHKLSRMEGEETGNFEISYGIMSNKPMP